MAIKTTKKHLDTYLKLVRLFPLVHIRDDKHLSAAQEMIDQLLEKNLDKGAQDYLDVLTDLVEVYEDEHHPIPAASEADVLRELMRGRGLSQPTLARAVKISQSTISAVLNGVRSLTKEQVLALAKFFNVSPLAFLAG
jgi:HTH-type transcriptional regulator/antitoxin HigA